MSSTTIRYSGVPENSHSRDFNHDTAAYSTAPADPDPGPIPGSDEELAALLRARLRTMAARDPEPHSGPHSVQPNDSHPVRPNDPPSPRAVQPADPPSPRSAQPNDPSSPHYEPDHLRHKPGADWLIDRSRPYDVLDPGPFGSPGWFPDRRTGRHRRDELPDPITWQEVEEDPEKAEWSDHAEALWDSRTRLTREREAREALGRNASSEALAATPDSDGRSGVESRGGDGRKTGGSSSGGDRGGIKVRGGDGREGVGVRGSDDRSGVIATGSASSDRADTGTWHRDHIGTGRDPNGRSEVGGDLDDTDPPQPPAPPLGSPDPEERPRPRPRLGPQPRPWPAVRQQGEAAAREAGFNRTAYRSEREPEAREGGINRTSHPRSREPVAHQLNTPHLPDPSGRSSDPAFAEPSRPESGEGRPDTRDRYARQADPVKLPHQADRRAADNLEDPPHRFGKLREDAWNRFIEKSADLAAAHHIAHRSPTAIERECGPTIGRIARGLRLITGLLRHRPRSIPRTGDTHQAPLEGHTALADRTARFAGAMRGAQRARAISARPAMPGQRVPGGAAWA